MYDLKVNQGHGRWRFSMYYFLLVVCRLVTTSPSCTVSEILRFYRVHLTVCDLKKCFDLHGLCFCWLRCYFQTISVDNVIDCLQYGELVPCGQLLAYISAFAVCYCFMYHRKNIFKHTKAQLYSSKKLWVALTSSSA